MIFIPSRIIMNLRQFMKFWKMLSDNVTLLKVHILLSLLRKTIFQKGSYQSLTTTNISVFFWPSIQYSGILFFLSEGTWPAPADSWLQLELNGFRTVHKGILQSLPKVQIGRYLVNLISSWQHLCDLCRLVADSYFKKVCNTVGYTLQSILVCRRRDMCFYIVSRIQNLLKWHFNFQIYLYTTKYWQDLDQIRPGDTQYKIFGWFA